MANLRSLALVALAAAAFAGVATASSVASFSAVQHEESQQVAEAESEYLLGAGIGDATGPTVGVNMMGYAYLSQISSGLQQRVRSRAYIIANEDSRVLFISTDTGQVDQNIVREVLNRLNKLYGDLYTQANTVISATHSHSGPGGFLQYLLFQVTSLGYVDETAKAMVEGIVRSVVRAHESLRPGKLEVGKGTVLNANLNRSPTAYANNPAAEKAEYQYNVDKEMVLLRMSDNNNKEIGNVNWFAVHGTSMNETSTIITGDNKGYASYLMEVALNADGSKYIANHFPSSSLGNTITNPVVSAFATTNLGDVTPNTLGAFCLGTEPLLPCDGVCLNEDGKPRSQGCVGRGPGFASTEARDNRVDVESTRIIGKRQFEGAMKILEEIKAGNKINIKGDIQFIHEFIDMTNQEIVRDGKVVGKTCLPALGTSFAAGTTDGPGALTFLQGENSTLPHPLLSALVALVTHTPSISLAKCHYPKSIILATGEFRIPYLWSPEIVDTQILRVGNLVILAVPGEFTTMAGRRIRKAIKKIFVEAGVFTEEEGVVVIAGLSNTYSHYITTPEEYQVQRYEGGSTLYGPYTFEAYVQQYSKLARALIRNEKIPEKLVAPNLIPKALSLLPPVVYDSSPLLSKFGSVVEDVKGKSFAAGRDSVVVKFWSGHPRNDLLLEKTFLTVERLDESTNQWIVVRDDGDWDTRFEWERVKIAESTVTVYWEIPEGMQPGTYRIRHFGAHKNILGKITPYQGASGNFNVY